MTASPLEVKCPECLCGSVAASGQTSDCRLRLSSSYQPTYKRPLHSSDTGADKPSFSAIARMCSMTRRILRSYTPSFLAISSLL